MPQQLILALAPAPAPTLASFFPGRNAAALAAVTAFLEPSTRDPFVYLFGAAGSGRTHLLEAVRAAAPDVEIADDVEQLSESDQIALFDRYNRTRAAGGRLLAAGDRPPAQLPLRDDLRTRL
ncbi:MAG: DnaA regulatory inactivator Hda, partial [Burkholderiales bacterium]